METTVSVIVPVYDSVRFLKKCAGSVLGQSLSGLELILADDGSTDGSSALCRELAAQDKRVRVLELPHKGVSAARNAGLETARGRYIFFADSDDWLPPAALEGLLRRMEAEDAELCVGAARFIGVIHARRVGPETAMSFDRADGESFLRLIEGLSRCTGPWGKLYCTELIRRHGLSFPERMAYGEDAVFLWRYLAKCRRAATAPEIAYCYSQLAPARASVRDHPALTQWQQEELRAYAELLAGLRLGAAADEALERRRTKLETDALRRAVTHGADSRPFLHKALWNAAAAAKRAMIYR